MRRVEVNKHQLSERDLCTKFITPAILQVGWQQHQFREEVNLTDGHVMVRGKLAARVPNPPIWRRPHDQSHPALPGRLPSGDLA